MVGNIIQAIRIGEFEKGETDVARESLQKVDRIEINTAIESRVWGRPGSNFSKFLAVNDFNAQLLMWCVTS